MWLVATRTKNNHHHCRHLFGVFWLRAARTECTAVWQLIVPFNYVCPRWASALLGCQSGACCLHCFAPVYLSQLALSRLARLFWSTFGITFNYIKCHLLASTRDTDKWAVEQQCDKSPMRRHSIPSHVPAPKDTP